MLDSRLRNHVDSIAAPVDITEVMGREPETRSPDGATVREPELLVPNEPITPTPGIWRPALVAAALLVVVALGGLLFVAVRDDSTSTLLADSGVGQLPFLPAGIADVQWRKVDEPFAPREEGNATMVADVTVVDGVAWAVGFEWRIVFENNAAEARKRGAIWRSTDGERWDVVDDDFGSLEIAGGNWTPSGTSFNKVVATSDGAIWAFGNDFRETVEPVGYRMADGENWELVQFPEATADLSQLVAASAQGDSVVAAIVDSANSEEVARTIATIDGRSWTPLSPQEARESAVPSNGEDFLVELPVGGAGLRSAAKGGSGFVAAGQSDQSNDVVEGEPQTSVSLLWHSAQGEQWVPIDRSSSATTYELTPRLVGHADGVLAAIEWIGESETGVSLVDIDPASGSLTSLGELPSATVKDMFILDDKLFVLGSEESAALVETDEDVSIWVAQKPIATTEG